MTAPQVDPALDDEAPDEAGLAPPVVVTVVAHEPGPWFEELLRSLEAQDYPNLSVLVIDAGGDDLIGRVAALLPSAFVRKIEGNPGFGAAANDVLEVVEGATFFCFCHDDVALEPDAIRHLVEEALRSNAAVVGPKLVDWDDPARLLDVGLAADKTGVVAPLVDRGELDQEQHDAIRDVFLVPTACVLVRADLFRALGGFDAAIELHGEDLDLCWRAQIAGGRVVVVPDARVRHRSRIEERRDTDEAFRLRARHRLRTVLTCYGRFHLLRVLPQALAATFGEIAVALATGQTRRARDVAGAWSWNVGRIGEIRQRRREVRALRRVPDAEVRELQAHGSLRLNRFVRGELGSAERVRDSLAGVGRELSESFTGGSRRLAVAVWVFALLVVLAGSRGFITDRVPLVSGFVPIAEGPIDLLRQYLRGWHQAGVGAEAPVPSAVALLGIAGLPVLGARGLLQLLLVVGMLPLGLLGAWRLTRPLSSSRARAAGLALYAANPLPYDALARGSWAGLLLYGASPWLLARVFRATGDEPFGAAVGTARIVSFGILLALLTAFVPVAALLFVVVALAVLVGSLVTGGARGALRALGLVAGGSAVAAVLHLPWTLDFVLPGASWWSVGGVAPMGPSAVSFADLLRFQVGSVGVPVLGWAIPLAAMLPLLIGLEWRFRWAVRCWAIALACWALAWTSGNGLLPIDLPPAHVLLAPAAASLSVAAGLGILAFEIDLRGYRFGVRQLASIATACLCVAALVPATVAAADGRWEAPHLDVARTLGFLDAADRLDGGARTLWIGDPEVLPLAGHRLADDVAYALSDTGRPDVVDRIATSTSSSTALVADALRLVADGRSDRLGRLLAPFGVRWVVLLSSSAPARANGVDAELPSGLAETVGRQLDLRRVEVDPAIDLFESTAWMPVRSLLTGADARALDSGRLFSTAAGTDFSDAVPGVGEIGAGTVHVGVPSSSRWHLEVDGEDAPRGKSLGWANRFEVERGGAATLSYRTPISRLLAVIAQIILWAIAVWLTRRPSVTEPAS
jgi:GT2 family glycosyltransferase